MRTNNIFRVSGSLILGIVVSSILIISSSHVSAVVPYITERVNLTPAGAQMTGGSVQYAPVISQDGRYVAFATTSSDMLPGDTNGKTDVYVRDRKLGANVRATLNSTGGEIAASVSGFTMSANGRFVLFSTGNSSVVPGDTNGKPDIFLRDLKNNTTELVSLSSGGGITNGSTSFYDISSDGRYVVFSNDGTNVVPGDTNGVTDIFLRDRKLGTTTLISKTGAGLISNGYSNRPSISCDGAYIAFNSEATNLVAGDTNGVQDLFLVNRIGGESITNITISGNGTVASPNAEGNSDISCNGQKVVLTSKVNYLLNDTNNALDIYVYDITDDTFERANIDSSGAETAGATSGLSANGSIDFSGRYVVFTNADDTLVTGDTNGSTDVFVRDLIDGTTQIVSMRNATTQTTGGGSVYYSVSQDGREVVFPSGDTGLVAGDTNGTVDIFVSKTGV